MSLARLHKDEAVVAVEGGNDIRVGVVGILLYMLGLVIDETALVGNRRVIRIFDVRNIL